MLATAVGIVVGLQRTQSVTPSSQRTGRVVPRTVWDGVYTKDQAARGRTAYALSCSGCHSMSLEGGDEGQPSLKGLDFRNRWNGWTLGSLFQTISDSMPYARPRSLSQQVYIDILSFLLQSNGMPAGATELSAADLDTLVQTLFTDKPDRK